MTKLPLLALPVVACTLAAHLYAADFWQTKPFTEWNDKDVQKLLQSSPWAKPVTVAMAGAGGANSGGLGDFTGLGVHKGIHPSDSGAPGGAPIVSLIVRWQSAKPVREAVIKAKFGNEAGTSAEAKKALEEQGENYIISVSGLPQSTLGGNADEFRRQMLDRGMLVIKGRDPIKPIDFIAEDGGRTAQGRFVFPKTDPITEDDKEVEFVVKIREVNIRQKFNVKDMRYNGKLDL
jgi:hypothetical protein